MQLSNPSRSTQGKFRVKVRRARWGECRWIATRGLAVGALLLCNACKHPPPPGWGFADASARAALAGTDSPNLRHNAIDCGSPSERYSSRPVRNFSLSYYLAGRLFLPLKGSLTAGQIVGHSAICGLQH